MKCESSQKIGMVYLILGILILLVFIWCLEYNPLKSTSVSITNVKEIKGFTITAYCPCRKCNGKWVGYIATGYKMAEMSNIYSIVAVDPKIIPLWSTIYYDNKWYKALDTGGAIKGNHIDILMSTHEGALEFGIKYNQTIGVIK